MTLLGHGTQPARKARPAIAAILGALDDKIDCNRLMNETLEAMARALFQSWFVDFDPVHAKAAGRQPFGMPADVAALFPDRFVDTKVGPMPATWEACKWGDISTLEYGKSLRSHGDSAPSASKPTRRSSSAPASTTGQHSTERSKISPPSTRRSAPSRSSPSVQR